MRIYREIATLYRQKKQYSKAISSLKSALKVVTRNRTQFKGTESHALRCFLTQTCTSDDVEQTEAEILYDIGEISRSDGDILGAEENLHKALEVSHKMSNPQVSRFPYHLQGRFFTHLGLPNSFLAVCNISWVCPQLPLIDHFGLPCSFQINLSPCLRLKIGKDSLRDVLRLASC